LVKTFSYYKTANRLGKDYFNDMTEANDE
jgi:hypothetical protein